jgi:hypothetical protein
LSSDSDGKSAEDTSIKNNYETITLPCINFPHSLPLRQNDNGYSIFMHITLIWDSMPSKRCLHCVFSDQVVEIKGSNGFLTSSLFYSLSRDYLPYKPYK